jgi:hypothetical protein
VSVSMDAFDHDRAEVDLLVRELNADKAGLPKTRDVQPSAPELRPGSRWTNVRLLMPSRRKRGLSERLAAGSPFKLPDIQLPQLDLPRMPIPRVALPDLRVPSLASLQARLRMPGPVMLVRLWVGLGALHSAAMTFWPYPKTYFWGMVFYLLSLALVLVTGVWGARLSWDQRLGAAHTIALATVLWAVTLATEAVPPI